MLTLTVDSRLVLRVRQECVCKVASCFNSFWGQSLPALAYYFELFPGFFH